MHTPPHKPTVLRSLAAALTTYVLWGILPIYWRSIHGVLPPEALSHRIVWSGVMVLLLWRPSGVRRAFGALNARGSRRIFAPLAALVLGVNWLIYIWGVYAGQVMEASLGYYISPLMSVLLAAVVLREPLRPLQGLAALCAGLGVALIIVARHQVPVFGLALASTFAVYGLLKKLSGLRGVDSFVVETLLLGPFALVYLVQLAAGGRLHFAEASPLSQALLVGSGAVSSVPLILFGIAGEGLSLSTLGVLQYLAPTVALSVAVLLYHEPLTPTHLGTFGLIWLGIAIYVLDVRRQAVAARSA